MLCFTGLTRVKDTVVGDAELRGVSGGQKRRVTVGEKVFDDLTLFMVCGLAPAIACILGCAHRHVLSSRPRLVFCALVCASPSFSLVGRDGG